MANEQIISVRVSDEFADSYAAYVTANFGDARGARSVALFDAINSQMNGGAAWLNQSHADQKMLILALERELETLRNRPERIPTPKKKTTWKPLSEHTNARLAVLIHFSRWPHPGGYTSSDISFYLNHAQSNNNVAKRIQELAIEGFLEATGKYRKSRDSGKMLTLWTTTGKVYEVAK